MKRRRSKTTGRYLVLNRSSSGVKSGGAARTKRGARRRARALGFNTIGTRRPGHAGISIVGKAQGRKVGKRRKRRSSRPSSSSRRRR